MIAVLIIPIESLRGQLKKDGYYFRLYKGQQIVQRCPSKWKDTPARKAARERFVATYGKSKKTQNDPKNIGWYSMATDKTPCGSGVNYNAENDNRHDMPDN